MLLTLAWRSLRRNPRRTAITIASIAIGLALAIFFVSLAEGVYRRAIIDGVRTVAGHLIVEHPAFGDEPCAENALDRAGDVAALAAQVPGVRRVRPFALGQGVAATGTGSAPVAVVGVDPAVEARGSWFAEQVVLGAFLAPGDERKAVVGRALARRLGLAPGKKLVLSSADARGELTSELVRVAGVFDTGVEALDGVLVHVPLSVARRLLGLGPDQVSQVGVVLGSHEEVPRAKELVAAALARHRVTVRTWEDALPDLAGWMRMDEKFNHDTMYLMLFLVTFTILNTILMSVVERQREHAVLLALGTSPRALRLQILAEAGILGLAGCALGAAAGVAASLYSEIHGLDLNALIDVREGAVVGGLPLDTMVHNWVTVGQVGKLVLLIYGGTLAIGAYCTRRATRLDVAGLLRAGR